MGLFNFRKKQPKKLSERDSLENITKTLVANDIISVPKDNNHNTFADSLDKLIDGDLPFGWVYHHRTFTEPIEKEYKYFLNMWVDARNKAPKELYATLKSFVLYMEDVEKICKEKGECFEFWFNEILTGKGYLKKRKQELFVLESNLTTAQRDYAQKQKELLELQRKIVELKPLVVQKLIENDNILQSEFWKMFDEVDRNAVSEIIYSLKNEGKIERTKSGKSYLLHYLNNPGNTDARSEIRL